MPNSESHDFCVCVCVCVTVGMDLGGSVVSGVATPPSPNDQSQNMKCSATDVLCHGNVLIYIAKRLVLI